MLKYSVALLNLAVVFVISFFFPADIAVEHQVPERMDPGEEVQVDLTVTKGKVSGFAKLELKVPEGLSIEAVEKSGASFSTEDNTAKFVWMALSEGNEKIELAYKLKAGAETSGKKTINGEFFYLDENERQSYEFPSKKVTVGKAKTAQAGQEDEEGKDEEEKDGEKEAEGGTDGGQEAQAQAGQDQPDEGADQQAEEAKGGSAERSITKQKAGTFLVEIEVDKRGLEGFAKVQDQIPEGFEATGKQTEGAVFSFEEQKAKFVWMKLPPGDRLTVSYQLKADGSNTGDLKISGEFSFLGENEESVTRSIPASDLSAEEAAPALAQKAEEEGADKGAQQEKPDEDQEEKDAGEKAEKEAQEEATAQDTQESEEQEKDVTDVPGPEEGVGYKVQIVAGHDPVPDDHIANVYDFQKSYEIERHEGWLKYTTGSFDIYKDARDRRVELRGNYDFPGPFVTAYNEGNRITVQEALMITKQEWVP